MGKKLHITVDEDKLKIIRNIKGLGKKDAEIVDNVLTCFLAQNGYLTKK